MPSIYNLPTSLCKPLLTFELPIRNIKEDLKQEAAEVDAPSFALYRQQEASQMTTKDPQRDGRSSSR